MKLEFVSYVQEFPHASVPVNPSEGQTLVPVWRISRLPPAAVILRVLSSVLAVLRTTGLVQMLHVLEK